jgi:hypothetical protein
MRHHGPVDARVSIARYAWLLPVAALGWAAFACNMPVIFGTGDSYESAALSTAEAIYDEAGMTLDEALEGASDDQRPRTLDLLGAPDAFALQWQELNGQTVRWEEWSYFDFESRFDFVDGELLWTMDIDPAADGSIYAHAFSPLDFEAGMSVAEVQAMLPDISMARMPLEEADIPGGLMLAGDQILLGFDQDELVYVQTFILSPDEPVDLDSADALTPVSPEASPAMPPESAAVLVDTFDSPSDTAVPLFDPSYMEFSIDDGVGVLVAHDPGILIARYPAPVLQDFKATITVWPPNPQSGAGYGLIFRGLDEPDGIPEYYLLLADPADALLLLQRWGAGNMTDLAQAPLPDTAGAPMNLHLEVAGNTFYAEVNEQPLLLVEDGAIPGPGVLGLAIHSHTDGDHVLFTDLRVEAADE